MYLCHFVTISG